MAFKPVDRKNFGFSTNYLKEAYDYWLIQEFYAGFREFSPSAELFNVLDGDEIVGLCNGVRNSKKHNILDSHEIQTATPYELISFYLDKGKGMASVNKRKTPLFSLSERSRKADQKVNVYNRKDLQERIEFLDRDHFDYMRNGLAEQPPYEFVFECNYRNRKMARNGDNHKLEVMHFMPVYPKKGAIKGKYAAELMRIMRRMYDNQKQSKLF